MEVTEQDLRERYESLQTHQLIELQAQGMLTETATRVLEQVLAERSVSAEERVAVTSEMKQRAAEQAAMRAALASLGERLGAQLFDGVVTMMFMFVAIFLWGAVQGLAVLCLIAAAAYMLLADGLPGGQSLGKRVLGIAVIDRRTHRPCSYGESFVRNILLWLLGIIDWIFIFSPTRQRLGDMAASTIVVRVNHPRLAEVKW